MGLYVKFSTLLTINQTLLIVCRICWVVLSLKTVCLCLKNCRVLGTSDSCFRY